MDGYQFLKFLLNILVKKYSESIINYLVPYKFDINPLRWDSI